MRRATRALLLHSLRLDVVEAAGAGESTLFSGLLLALLVGVLAGGATRGMAPAVGLPLAFLFLGLFALVDAVGDAATAFLDPRDLPLLRTLPIDSATYLRARLLALLVPIGVKSLALSLPLALGTAVARASLAPLAIIAAVALMELVLTAAAVVVLIATRRLLPSFVSLRDLLIWARVLILVGGTAAWLLFIRGGESWLARLGAVAAVPTGWFAHLLLVVTREPGARPGAALCAAAASVATALALALLAPGYVRLLDLLEHTPPSRRWPQPLKRACELVFVHPDERPTFRLGVALLRRERTFRLQTYPLLAYPLLFLFLGRGADDRGLFALLFANLPPLVVALAVLFLRHSDSEGAGFWAACFGVRGGALASGARKALWYAIVLPLELVVTLLLISDRGVAFGFAAGAASLAVATALVVTAHAPEPDLPFSRPFRGWIDPGSDGPRLFAGALAIVALAVGEAKLLQRGDLGARDLAGLAGASVAATLVLMRRGPPAAMAAPQMVRFDESGAVPPARARPPFPVRLRRELMGVGLFFALSAAALLVLFVTV
jgi:hypothetical protein